MKPQQITVDVLREKYARPGEADAEAIRRRVARALAAGESDPAAWQARFLAAQQHGFIPAGRINAVAGTRLEATQVNCFVQPVGDSIAGVEDGRPGIYPALQQAAETLRRGGGVGYDFSAIRPEGALVHSTQSRASGPVSYMRLFDRSYETAKTSSPRQQRHRAGLRLELPAQAPARRGRHRDLSHRRSCLPAVPRALRRRGPVERRLRLGTGDRCAGANGHARGPDPLCGRGHQQDGESAARVHAGGYPRAVLRRLARRAEVAVDLPGRQRAGGHPERRPGRRG